MQHLRITVQGISYEVTVERLDAPESTSPPAPIQIVRAAAAGPVAAPKAVPKAAAAAGDVTSPLAGIVKSLDVPLGTKVKAGDLVITLEAMKMYTAMNAPVDGTITAIHVKVGDAVDEDQPLYTLG
ncbi:MAG: biotin/lipoyl-binding protein [Verrucomicrobia bacterium]|nr:biotin/lipoyl-binding protein [Verrucomicrobiota bacterium]